MKYATPFSRSLKIQFRVIGALLMREVLTRYGRHNIGFLWLFVEPMLFTLGVTILWTVSKAVHGTNIPIVAFALTGYSSVLLWRNMPSRCSGAIEPNLSLMYHRHVKVNDIFASRILLEFVGATLSFVFLSMFFFGMGWMKLPENILEVVLGWFLIAWFGASFAILIGALSAKSEVIEKLWHPFSYLLFPLSGSGFMVDWLPTSMQKIVLFLPMVHGVEIVREGFLGSSVHAHYDFGYVVIFCLCMTLLGLAILSDVARKVIPE